MSSTYNRTSSQPDRLQEIWSKLSAGDKFVILGHSQALLPQVDRARFTQIMAALGRARRQSS